MWEYATGSGERPVLPGFSRQVKKGGAGLVLRGNFKGENRWGSFKITPYLSGKVTPLLVALKSPSFLKTDYQCFRNSQEISLLSYGWGCYNKNA
ncbi:hypothetical protein ODJ80_02340 [Acutalibacter sp. LFL-21]|uniref:hypothetical protein n=1 Tax=Acutalibacter sp. LFL-21 TaxID=2983399 RepID=UPI0021D69C66|nr:hypothetical protein [Acutalibacter sp. LFL-21]MCU7651655.1 hypothetical protein [Acutalibacter sp. LFL-21]